MSTGSETLGGSASDNDGTGIQQVQDGSGSGSTQLGTTGSNTLGDNAVSITSATENKIEDLGFWFKVPIVATFIWIFFGVSGIFGYYMFCNEPLRPPFAAFAVVAFSVIVAYSIVLSLQIVSGQDIAVEIGGYKLAGPSGPVLFWALSFLVIMYGFSLVNIGEIIKAQTGPFKPITRLGEPSAPEGGTTPPAQPPK